MQSTVKITEDLIYLGVNDRRLELFENMFPLTNGVSYNSYVLLDEKTVLFDTVDGSALKQFAENLDFALAGRELDYLIVNHMEPDHAETLSDVLLRYPNATVVGNPKTFNMMKQFGCEATNTLCVAAGDILDCGTHKLTFIMAPMVHWPEVMVTYDTVDKILFSADAFGTFGALDGRIFADQYDFDRDWLDDARRYFTNIVGKYGAQAASLLTKAGGIEIEMVCPLHGPVWRENVEYFVQKQMTWSKYEAENKDEIFLVYASMYGNTESVVNAVATKLSQKGKKVTVLNACNTDKSYLIAQAFKMGSIIIAAPTYNGGIYPAIETFILDMKSLNLQNRDVYIIENGSWAPVVCKKATEILSTMKNMPVKASLTIKSSLQDEQAVDTFIQKIL